MAPEFGSDFDQIPLVPQEVLRKHHVHEPNDTRFRSAARLLQALWREDRQLPLGSYKRVDGRLAKLGSRITTTAGRAGGNFLSPEIAHLTKRAIIYREIGAAIDQERLLSNLLSSMPLTFNLLGPLALDLKLATAVCHEILPGFDGTVGRILFEHSPGRGDVRYTADGTAFDALIRYRSAAGKRGFIAIETKYSEAMQEPVPPMRPRYEELTHASGLYIDPGSPHLRADPFQQLWREHLLAQTMLQNDLYDEGTFLFIAPKLNWYAQNAARAYACQLDEPKAGHPAFLNVQLETVVEAIRAAGSTELADKLHRRYCDFWLVDGEIELEVFGPKATSPPSSKPRIKRKASEFSA